VRLSSEGWSEGERRGFWERVVTITNDIVATRVARRRRAEMAFNGDDVHYRVALRPRHPLEYVWRTTSYDHRG
jgi:hypothetical protein